MLEEAGEADYWSIRGEQSALVSIQPRTAEEPSQATKYPDLVDRVFKWFVGSTRRGVRLGAAGQYRNSPVGGEPPRKA